MSKTMYVVPGFGEMPTDKQYKELKVILESKGYTVIIAPIHWKYRVMTDYIAEAESYIASTIKKHPNASLLGFSFGAYISSVVVPKFALEHVYLCSLSPYFAEDLPHIPKAWHIDVGKRRIADFSTYSFAKVFAAIHIPTTLFLGALEAVEFPDLKKRNVSALKKINDSQLIMIPNAPHDIGNSNYQEMLQAHIK